MSDEAFARYNTREIGIWTPFIHSYPCEESQTVERAEIFGLYSHSYLNSYEYLNEMEKEDLANLLADYTSKMAGLTAQEQMVIADIAGKRYLSTLEKAIFDDKMLTKQAKNEYDAAMMDAKMAALAADRAALATMAEKLQTEILKTSAKVSELRAQLGIEEVNYAGVVVDIAEKQIQSARTDIKQLETSNQIQSIQTNIIKANAELEKADVEIAEKEVQSGKMDLEKINVANDTLNVQNRIVKAQTDLAKMDIELAEKQLDSAEMDLKILQAQNGVLQIQANIVKAGAELADIQVQIARTKAQIASTEVDKSKQLTLPSELTLAQAQTTQERAETTLAAARITFAQAQTGLLNAEIGYVAQLIANEATLFGSKSQLLQVKQMSRMGALSNKLAEESMNSNNKVLLASQEATLAATAAGQQAQIDGIVADGYATRGSIAWDKANALVAAAIEMAKVTIATKLVHRIGKIGED
jgi:chromosome segregation ATPase